MRCYVLTGGQSSRMGSPKERLILGGMSFLQRVSSAAAAAFDEVIIVGRGRLPWSSDFRTLVDEQHRDVAPIFGVVRALRDAAEHEDVKAWILAVDYPLIDSGLLGFLRGEFESSDVELMVPVVDGNPQMLCAGYSTSLVPQLTDLIGAEQYALRPLIQLCRSRLVEEPVIASRFDLGALQNINTPADLVRLQRTHEQAHAS